MAGLEKQQNPKTINLEMDWLLQMIEYRMKLHWQAKDQSKEESFPIAPDLSCNKSEYADFILKHQLSTEQRICLLIGLAPHFRPAILDIFFIKNTAYDRGFTEFGGIKGVNHSGFLPTAETAAFVLAGDHLEKRFELLHMFMNDPLFNELNVIRIQASGANEPFLSGALSIQDDYLNYFITGVKNKPSYRSNFPAKLLTTALNWSHLVLEDSVLDEVMEICDWLEHQHTLMVDWEMQGKLKPGFRGLFYGPPGTGKTLTATLLGKKTGLDVYRIDLSMVVSKYIGETEKNLSNIFDQAINKNWILFFDEADALFGKRTQTSSSNDRHSNQEISYLLQRIEEFPGMVLLATNFETNIDEAFSRRFQAMINFPLPGPEERLRLWQQAYSKKAVFEKKVELAEIAEKYELSGGALVNVVRYSSLQAAKRKSNEIWLVDIAKGIRREFSKEGKTMRS